MNASLTQKCALAIVLCVSSCVVPMPIESIGDQVNLPPYFTSEFTEPAPDLIIEFDPEEESLIEFNTGPIGDPNPNDRIYWRWFVDYRAETSDLPIEFSEANGATPAQLIDGIRKEFRPCSTGTKRLLSDDPMHRLEVMVSDRPFTTSQADDPQPNKTLPSDAHSFSLVWFIRFDRADCP